MEIKFHKRNKQNRVVITRFKIARDNGHDLDCSLAFAARLYSVDSSNVTNTKCLCTDKIVMRKMPLYTSFRSMVDCHQEDIMAGNIRVQMYVPRSNRKHLFLHAYDDIKSALKALKVHAVSREMELISGQRGTLTTNYTDTVTVTHGNVTRVYTLVTKKDRTPIPFGHLLKVNQTS